MINLVRFDIMLDSCVRDVFSRADGSFSRDSAGGYVCGNDLFGSDSFGQRLERGILSKTNTGSAGVFQKDYFFIIGDCRPALNILLDLDHTPFKWKKTRYGLTEKDLKIDRASFNRRADFVFNRLFKRKADMPHNVFAIGHSRLGAGTMKALLQCIFGRVNCIDMDQDALGSFRRCVTNENDSIEASVRGKSRLNGVPEMKVAAA